MKIYNTLSRSIAEFKPINPPKVGIYSCGPTVYEYPHIGNLRTFVFSDLFERTLSFNGYNVKSVQNITDIDDKIINKAKEEKVSIKQISEKYEKFYFEDINKINIKKKDVVPHATEYIEKMQKYIETLLENGLAYKEKDGSIYFDISKFENYGKLSGIEADKLKTGTRILSDEYDKDNVQDFALWKAEEKSEVGYDSPWGWGRPGWHLECSVMAQNNLGETIDIHTGGIDLIFPHHENEIAQSEGVTGKKFANYFVHAAHILVDGKKMSKSLGNFYRLKDIEEKGIDSIVLRYLFLQTHYRQEMNFTWDALGASQTALNKLRSDFASWGEPKIGCAEYEERFLDAINDDLNIPKALSIVWELIKSDYPGEAKKKSLLKMDEVLGLGLKDYRKEKIEIPFEVAELLKKRESLRADGKFDEADSVRKDIEEKGYSIEDTPEGPNLV